MKKIGILTLIFIMMTMVMGCSTTTYTFQFNDINKVVVVNKTTAKEVELSKDQITTVIEELGKITLEDETEDLGEEYLYKLTMNSSTKDPVELYIYDATHVKIAGKLYVATENDIDMIYYQSLFK